MGGAGKDALQAAIVLPAPASSRKSTFRPEDLIANSRPTFRSLKAVIETVPPPNDSSLRASNRVFPFGPTNNDGTDRPQWIRTASVTSSREGSISRYASSIKRILVGRRVVKHGLSFPVIFIVSVAIAVTYSLALMAPTGTRWRPADLTGSQEWTSTTRTHLAQDPLVFLDQLLRNTSIGDDTSVSTDFLRLYSRAVEANVQSTSATFNATWLDTEFILQHGFAIAGIMAGSFEGYALWPCRLALPLYPTLLAPVCEEDKGWFTVEIFNNLVATTSEKASTYLSMTYTPMSLMSTRIWAVTPPTVTASGIVLHGYKRGTYTNRQYWLLLTQRERLALTRVVACDRSTQSNARECDRLETDDVFVRNVATRDFSPPDKLDKIRVYGPAYAMGNFEAAGKTFVQLPASAIMMTDTGYSATTRFATTIPFRLTIAHGRLTTESNVYQVASASAAVGATFLFAAVQMLIVCLMVYNAIAHCYTTDEIDARERRIFGFSNHITMGVIARRLGTYKFVFLQLVVAHALNVGTFFSATHHHTATVLDAIAFAAEGFLLVVVSCMLVDQVFFFEKYSSTRETLTVLSCGGLYLAFLYVHATRVISTHQVQVTELPICAGANQCTVVDGYRLYYAGLAAVLVLPLAVVNGPIHRWVVPTRSAVPAAVVGREQLTSFEKFCLGLDARREFGAFDRSSGATPISIVHAAGFTYVGPYLVRIKDYYMVVFARLMHPLIVESSGLTLTVFKIREGKVVSGQHMALVAAMGAFREANQTNYAPLR